MSQSLPNLTNLTIKDTCIISLHYLPKTLKSLKQLRLINNKLNTLKNLPQNLPSLRNFTIIDHSLSSLLDMPQKFPKLYNFSIICPKLQNLEGFPCYVPSLNHISVGMTQFRDGFKDFIPIELETFKGLPQSIPQLNNFTLVKGSLRNFDHFPTNIPELERINFEHCTFFNLIGYESLPLSTHIRFCSHHAKLLKLFLDQYQDRLQLEFLPPYCPDLNEIECVWRQIKQEVVYNAYYPTFNKFEQSLTKSLLHMSQSNGRIRSICGRNEKWRV